jgi:hypothetical protein
MLVRKYHTLLIKERDVFFLDLSVTGLTNNLYKLSKAYNFNECDVIYDTSKPLNSKKDNFQMDLTDIAKRYNLFPNVDFSFPKIKNIQEVNSKKEIGIQIADIMNRSIVREGFLKDMKTSSDYFGNNVTAMLPYINFEEIYEKKPKADEWLKLFYQLAL